MSASASGARCARTTAPTATPGTTCRTTRHARAPTAGARTASPASATTQQRLCFALTLWNGADPILKERLFGLSGPEGNHGEDVKEYYFYLDNLPSHAYMKFLYKYPQQAFPYEQLRAGEPRRSRLEPEYELLDTGIFDDDRYFDVFIEYAKAGPDDLLVRISAINRGPEAAPLHLLPTLWFRNDWSWTPGHARPRSAPTPRAPTCWPPRIPSWRRTGCTSTPPDEAAVHRQRQQPRAAVGRSRPAALPRTPSTTTWSTAAPTR